MILRQVGRKPKSTLKLVAGRLGRPVFRCVSKNYTPCNFKDFTLQVGMPPFLITVLIYVRLFLDKMIDFMFSLYWDDRKQMIPDLDKSNALLAQSATTLAKRIKEKDLKSEDLVRTVIERIKQVNPIINAVVAERYEAALQEAREIDKAIAEGISDDLAKKPFLGVPFTTKESQAIKDMPYTLGLWCRRNAKASEDSEAIIMLKAAGAIPLAATNLPELLIWQETRNPVYGMTRNPHHTGRSPGGSSGAEAALMASYATPISLCSDIGGSTRMPAFYCGMFGHHPTAGTTSTKGVLFRKVDQDTMFCLGFISKHVEDLPPLTKIIAGEKARLLKLDRKMDLKDINFYYLENSNDHFVSPLRSEMKSALDRVITKIRQESSTEYAPKPYYHEGFNHMYKLWSYWMSKEPENYASLMTDGREEANPYVEMIKKVVGASKYCLFTIMRLLEAHIMPKPNPDWAEDLSRKMKEDLFSKLGENGVLLMPSAPHAAPFHYSCLLRPYNFSYFSIVNVLKCPATQVPLGTNGQGLPIGIQVLAAPYNDDLCLSVAKYLEEQFSGAIMACKIKQ